MLPVLAELESLADLFGFQHAASACLRPPHVAYDQSPAPLDVG